MNTPAKNSCACAACSDANQITPANVHNDAGLDTLKYRVGTHGSFKNAMLKSLSASGVLRELSTRENEDPTIALIDAWAMVLDVLTFYQERNIQEGYLRTSDERLSLVELARHISYRPKPGVAASTWLAFSMDESPGAPLEASIGVGSKVQSIPGQDEKPQIFETIEKITARTAFNAIKPKLRSAQTIGKGSTQLYLQGANVQIQTGDVIAIVGEQRFDLAGSESWDIRTVRAVKQDAQAGHTLISWREGLGHDAPLVYPGSNAKVYVFRQRASLFGFNAPDFNLFSEETQENFGNKNGAQWPNFNLINEAETHVFTDAVYPKFVSNSWIALDSPTYTELYRVIRNVSESKVAFSLSSKVSKLELDTNEHFSFFNHRKTLVLGQSEELPLAEAPLLSPVFGQTIELAEQFENLQVGQKIIISGEAATQLIVTPRSRILKTGSTEIQENFPLNFITDVGPDYLLRTDEILKVGGKPTEYPGLMYRWPLVREGKTGYVDAKVGDLLSWQAPPTAPVLPSALNQKVMLSEAHIIEAINGAVITLKAPLENVLLRETVRINANVAEATHGESKLELLGSGDGSQTFQKFRLKQKPLTYVSAASISGTASTLEIRVNDILWQEVPTFYGRGPDERIYVTRTDDDGSVSVQFGDGVTGARLPSGTENIRAKYRIGIGLEALLKAGQLSMLMSPQLGVKSVLNPCPPGGAEDPEPIEDIRHNAPLTVLGLDRIVSVPDYQFFANAFAGIGKARADLLWKGSERTLHLTVASAAKGSIGNDLKEILQKAIDSARHALFPVVINSFIAKPFGLKVKIKTMPEYVAELVLQAVEAALLDTYNFDMRDFGQSVASSEIIAVMQAVEGVVAVDLDELGGQNPFGSQLFRLRAHAARWNGIDILPAELLILSPELITLSLWDNAN